MIKIFCCIFHQLYHGLLGEDRNRLLTVLDAFAFVFDENMSMSGYGTTNKVHLHFAQINELRFGYVSRKHRTNRLRKFQSIQLDLCQCPSNATDLHHKLQFDQILYSNSSENQRSRYNCESNCR